jgi:hypothetical protein
LVAADPARGEDGQVQAGLLDQAAETIAASRELIRTSRLLIASIREAIAGSKRRCERHVASGLFDPPAALLRGNEHDRAGG